MNVKQTIQNTLVAFAAQGLSMFLSVVQSLIIPKLLGITEYGYWQLFIFYASYVGFFHLGLNDGVYLLKGGQDRRIIDASSVKAQFLLGVSVQSLVAIALVVLSFSKGITGDRQFVIACTSVYLVIQNSASYLMFVLQAMNETKRSSYSTMVNRISFLMPLVILLALHASSFKPFVIAYITSAALQLFYCIWNCRDILSANTLSLPDSIRESVASIRVGVKLMLANIASQLILGVLRQSIDAAWGIEEFGKLSLSLSLVNFFLAFVSQAAMVLFPALRQSEEKEVRSFFYASSVALGILFPALYLLYYPLVWLLGLWLPAYAESLRFFTWLIPICVFDSKMNITCTTLFKVRREESKLLCINVVTTLACTAMVMTAVYGLGSIEAAMASATLAIIGRSLFSERLVSRELEINSGNLSLWEIVLTTAFVALTLLQTKMVAACVYSVLYLVFLSAHRSQIADLIRSLHSHR